MYFRGSSFFSILCSTSHLINDNICLKEWRACELLLDISVETSCIRNIKVRKEAYFRVNCVRKHIKTNATRSWKLFQCLSISYNVSFFFATIDILCISSIFHMYQMTFLFPETTLKLTWTRITSLVFCEIIFWDLLHSL